METIKVGLIKGRHPLPVEGYIFNEDITFPLNFNEINKVVEDFIITNIGVTTSYGVGINMVAEGGRDTRCYKGEKALIVYVTGLTACTAEVIRVCMLNGVSLTLMHYDPSTSEYIPQFIL